MKKETLNIVQVPRNEGSWSTEYQRVIHNAFEKHFELREYSGNDQEECWTNIVQDDHAPNEKWFCVMAHDRVAEMIRSFWKDSVIFGHLHGTTGIPYTSVFNYDMKERVRLPLLDYIFTNSRYGKERVLSILPELEDKIGVVGFPVDFSLLHTYLPVKEKKSVAFTQRFSFDKNFPTAVEVGRRLVEKGYKVTQFIGGTELDFALKPEYAYRKVVEDTGIQFKFNDEKTRYYSALASTETVIFTSLAENMSVAAIEAAEMKCHVVAPRAFSFAEMLPSGSLYSPFDIGDIVDRVVHPISILPYSTHKWTEASLVCERYLDVMLNWGKK